MQSRRLVPSLLVASALLIGCGEQQPATEPAAPPPAAKKPGPLAEQLRAKADAGMKRMPPEVVALFQKAGEELAASKLDEQAKSVGAKAPLFSLKDGAGEPTSLATLLEQGPVVLTFYRGKW